MSGFKFFRQIILLVLLNSCIQNMYKDVQFSGFAAKLLNFMTFFKSVLNNLSFSWQTAGFQHWVFTFSQYFTFPCCLFVTSLTNTQQHVWFSQQRAQLQVYSPNICVFFPLQPQKNQPKIPHRYKRRPGHLPVTTCMLGSAPSPSCTRRVTEEGCVPPLTWVFIALPWSAAGWMSESESRP